MAFEYTKKARDTMYAGCLFRSRLEATWAAFFDICGIKWVYEPFDLPGWSPDFLIQDRVVVEVKPIQTPDIDVVNKMLNAAISAKLSDVHCLLLLGCSPISRRTLGWYPVRIKEECGCCFGCTNCPYEFPQRVGCTRGWCTEIGEVDICIFEDNEDEEAFHFHLSNRDENEMFSGVAVRKFCDFLSLPKRGRFTRSMTSDLLTSFNQAKNKVRFTVR